MIKHAVFFPPFVLVGLPVSALAGATPMGSGAPDPFTSMLLPMAIIFAIFYFLIIRPQAKKQKEHQKMLGDLGKGDRIVTSGGIHGVVVGVKDDVIQVKIAENVRVDVNRSAIATVKEKGENGKDAAS